MDLKKEIENIINKASAENESDTPDFILAEYLIDCLKAFNKATNKRQGWYGNKKKDDGNKLKEPKIDLKPIDPDWFESCGPDSMDHITKLDKKDSDENIPL